MLSEKQRHLGVSNATLKFAYDSIMLQHAFAVHSCACHHLRHLSVVPRDAITFRFSRSSGPGGQHVNKVNTRVEARFRVADASAWLTERERTALLGCSSVTGGAGANGGHDDARDSGGNASRRRREGASLPAMAAARRALNRRGEIVVTSQRSRSQARNIDDCIAKIQAMVDMAASVPYLQDGAPPSAPGSRQAAAKAVAKGAAAKAQEAAAAAAAAAAWTEVESVAGGTGEWQPMAPSHAAAWRQQQQRRQRRQLTRQATDGVAAVGSVTSSSSSTVVMTQMQHPGMSVDDIWKAMKAHERSEVAAATDAGPLQPTVAAAALPEFSREATRQARPRRRGSGTKAYLRAKAAKGAKVGMSPAQQHQRQQQQQQQQQQQRKGGKLGKPMRVKKGKTRMWVWQ